MVKKDDNIHYKKVEIVILFVLFQSRRLPPLQVVRIAKLIQSNKSMDYSKKGFPGLFG